MDFIRNSLRHPLCWRSTSPREMPSRMKLLLAICKSQRVRERHDVFILAPCSGLDCSYVQVCGWGGGRERRLLLMSAKAASKLPPPCFRRGRAMRGLANHSLLEGMMQECAADLVTHLHVWFVVSMGSVGVWIIPRGPMAARSTLAGGVPVQSRSAEPTHTLGSDLRTPSCIGSVWRSRSVCRE